MRVLGLIPARGGSKEIPRKSICLLAGKPLLQYTIEAAHSVRLLDRVVLSTDPEIAEVGPALRWYRPRPHGRPLSVHQP